MPSPVGGITAQAPLHGSVDSAMSALGGMDSEGFLKLLVAQLRYQSPLEPADPGDLMMQTATLAQLDATQQLLATQQRDLGLQQAVAAAGLLGTTVTALGDGGAQVVGQVDGVRYTDVGPVLEIGGQEVHLSNVLEVRRATATGADTATAAPTTTTATPSTSTTTSPSGLIADEYAPVAG